MTFGVINHVSSAGRGAGYVAVAHNSHGVMAISTAHVGVMAAAAVAWQP